MLDIAIVGNVGPTSQPSPICKVLQGDGTGNFADIGAGLPGVWHGGIAWCDYDNDGYLDLGMCGDNASGQPIAKVYHNNGNGTFSEDVQNDALVPVDFGSLAWGDYDNDGLADMLLAGNSPSGQAPIYHNEGARRFALSSFYLQSRVGASADWGDAFRSKSLSFAYAGVGSADYLSYVYKNEYTLPNTPPTQPTNLYAVHRGDTLEFHWTAASDAEGDSSELTYNVFAGLMVGIPTRYCSPLASLDPTELGTRYVPRFGNAGKNTWKTVVVPGLQSQGPLYWGVQAIDAGYAASSFATQGPGYLGVPRPPRAAASLELRGSNPIRGVALLQLSLPYADNVVLEAYDLAGRRVACILTGRVAAGTQEVRWDLRGRGRMVEPAVYFVRLRTSRDDVSVRTVVLH